MNLLSLDFDSGVSDVNVANRLILFVENIRTGGSTMPLAKQKTHRENRDNEIRQEIML